MSKIIIYVMLFCATFAKAQNIHYSVNVHAGGHIIAAYPANKIDSITFTQVSKEVLDNLLAFTDTTLEIIKEEETPDLTIHQGIVCQKEQSLRIMRGNEVVAIVKLSEPQIIAQAKDVENWGYFQFPILYRAENNNLIVYWQMKADSHTGYGEESYGWRMSKDEGVTWEELDRDYFRKERTRVEFCNGDVLQVKDLTTKDIDSYTYFPQPVNEESIEGYYFYKESELPEELQGVYHASWNKQTNSSSIIHGKIEDIGLLRRSIGSKMPVVWWGNIKENGTGSLLAGVYPCYYQNPDGSISKSGISFYSSRDAGNHWIVEGKIPFSTEDGSIANVFDGSDGFSEPTFEILRGGSLICVMRSGSYSPMYRSYSYDNGQHWSTPQPFTPNGVMPNLLLLDNGVLILASGRPGMQIRFNISGDGLQWTEPIEMLPFINEKGNYNTTLTNSESCGYPSVLRADDHTFYITYSDFKRKNEKGEERKSIMFRRIEVIK